ncbi:MAG: tetratricopeptide repeat protein [Deltaproteobacteria bacterium]|nr:tetratricopeptide repeat protein [Deltaproteobacteria bacterium]
MTTDDPEGDAKWAAVDDAVEMLRDGDRDGAVRELTGVLATEPKNEYAAFFLGCALFELGRFDYASTAFAQAVRSKPTYLGARINLAHSLRMEGRIEEALREARRAEQLAPDDGDVHYALGLIYVTKNLPAVADQHLERFLATRPDIEVAEEVRALLTALRGGAVTTDDGQPPPPRLRPS